MRREEYKLTLHYRLQQMTHEDYPRAMEWLPSRLKISTSTFKRWIYMRESDPAQVPANAIIQMAIFFECTPSEMFTKPVNKQELDADWEIYKSQFKNDLEQISRNLTH